ncbi:hypothetical protein F2Q69_00008626 [Brassica cretica]|uniref:Uncharacterized protein n=1 Tax=Brassica cretica TaxID=69181 RepID=A0A8S9PR20_BRACR|nr:hypothetical protein F2Q69_00008626 [Brassica cretica]
MYDNGDLETFVLLGDTGTEVMGRQAQDLMDYYLEEKKVLKKGSSEAVENISRMGKKNRINPSEMTMNIEEEAKAMGYPNTFRKYGTDSKI